MTTKLPSQPRDVASAFDAFPKPVRRQLLRVRNLLFETAGEARRRGPHHRDIEMGRAGLSDGSKWKRQHDQAWMVQDFGRALRGIVQLQDPTGRDASASSSPMILCSRRTGRSASARPSRCRAPHSDHVWRWRSPITSAAEGAAGDSQRHDCSASGFRLGVDVVALLPEPRIAALDRVVALLPQLRILDLDALELVAAFGFE